jgi:xylulokinase
MSYLRGRPAFLGIDLGTSQLKALLAAPDGHVLGRGRARYQVDVPAEGRAETDPQDWWRAAGAAVREALAAAAGEGAPVDVQAVAVAGQMHGVVLADAAGAPVRPAILWLDRRAAAEAAYYAELPAELTAPLGNQPSPGMAGPILRWLAAHEPAVVANASWALQPKDWLRLRLTGAAATDPTDASGTLLFDLARGSWAADLVRALGLPADKLPRIRDPAQVAGALRPAAAAHLGIGAGVPVATGAADTAAALFAAGLPGDAALLTLGTGGQWLAPAGLRPVANTNLFRAIGGGGQSFTGLYRLAAVQNMGETINWVRTMLGVSWEHAYSTAGRPWRADTPVFLPYLVQERWDPSARGCWAGLTLAHGKDDLLRAALEGVAFLLRDRLSDLRAAGHDPARVIIGGGGSSHPAWRQLLADVLGLPLYPAPTTWLSAVGAARLAAAAATGAWPEGAGTGRSADETEVIAPGERDAASAGYGRFLTLSRMKGSGWFLPTGWH